MEIKDNVRLEEGFLSSSVKLDKLCRGDKIVLPENHVIENKRLTFTARISELSDGEVIMLGHGEKLYTSSYLALTKKEIKIYEYLVEEKELFSAEHGLEISGLINIVIEVGYSSSRITISTSSGVYLGNCQEHSWSGRNGSVFAYCNEKDLEDVTLRWYCPDIKKDIWLFGDSYFNPTSPIRWPSYLVTAGYKNYLLTGFPGRNTASALLDFKELIKYATPKFAVWCMGMNDMDDGEQINESYKNSTDEFLAICKERGIIPILSTTPCVPERSNIGKNNYVRESGYRYIDFAKAVGGEEMGSPWFSDMLSSDLVHPGVLGAKALYIQVITDFPEIME